MGFSAGNIEADLTLNLTPFAQGLRQARTEADAFERQKIEAKADVDTSSVSRKLSESTKLLLNFNRRRATATANIAVKGVAGLTAANRQLTNFGRRRATAIAQIDLKGRKELTALSTALTAFGKRKVTAKVGVDADPARKALGGLLPLFSGVGRGADDAGRRGNAFSNVLRVLFGNASEVGGTLGKLAGGIQNVGQSVLGGLPLIGGMTGGLSKMGLAGVAAGAALAGALIAAVVAAGAALAALVSSLALASAGFGALAVAGGGFLAAGLAIGIGAMNRYKATSEIAGSAANWLKKSLTAVGKAFTSAVRPGSIAVLKALGDVIGETTGNVKALQPAFTAMGRSIASALVAASPQISALVTNFGKLVKAAAPMAGPIVKGIVALGHVLINIARAAMPSLISGARSVASAMQGWARSTGNIGAIRKTIVSLVGHLKSWGNLAKQVGSVMVNFFRAAAPSGKSLVDSLAKGAKSLADWLKSAQGQKTIKNFFALMVPLVKEAAKFIGTFGSAFLKSVAIVAPLATVVFKAFNALLAPINAVLGLLLRWAGPVNAALTAAWQGLKAAAGPIWKSIANAITHPVQTVKNVLRSIWNGIKSAASSVWSAIKSVAGSIWKAIGTAVTHPIQTAKGLLSSAWAGIKSAAMAVWNGLKSAASSIWGAIKTAVMTPVNAIKSGAASAWAAIKSGASRAWEAIKTSVQRAWQAIKQKARDFYNAGKDLIAGLARGIKDAAVAVYNKIAEIAGNVRDRLKKALRISSPSQAMVEIGQNISKGLALGISAAAPSVLRALDRDLIAPLSKLTLPALSLPVIGNGGVAALSMGATTRTLTQAASFPPPRRLNTAPTPTRPTSVAGGSSTYNATFNIPPSPAAHGQPEARDTAAKLELYLRDRGMSFGRRGR